MEWSGVEHFTAILHHSTTHSTHSTSGVARNCQMGVLEKVGREYAPCAKCAGAHVSAPLRWGVGVLPKNFFCFTCSEIDSNAI